MRNSTSTIPAITLTLCLILTGGCAQPTSQSKTVTATPPQETPPTQPQPQKPADQRQWIHAHKLRLEGKGWADTQGQYERLPARAQANVPKPVWQLSKHTAGICVRFITNSPKIWATWDGGGAMNHMAATGNSGLDLYRRAGDSWIFAGVGRPQTSRTTALVGKNLTDQPTEYLLYLPLYQSVGELKIGLEPDATIEPADPRSADRARPIVFYGTSITQGGCAARAGMCHPTILGRWLDREVINLGFSGSGKMEPALAELLAELDPAVYVLECLPNMTTEMVGERVVPFVQTLRRAHPTTPILLVENPLRTSVHPQNQALQKAHDQLIDDGFAPLHYLPGQKQLSGRENGTVDGVHPTDLGFLRMAKCYEPVLKDILAGE